MRQTNQNTNRSESDHEIIKRFKEIIYKEPDPMVEDNLNPENTSFYKNKYFLIIALSLTAVVS